MKHRPYDDIGEEYGAFDTEDAPRRKRRVMSKKLNPKIEAAALKLAKYLGGAAAAATTGAFLMIIFKTVLLPVLSLILSELLKTPEAKVKYGKYLRPARDILDSADLGDV
jgi:hypothetical protein